MQGEKAGRKKPFHKDFFRPAFSPCIARLAPG
jgi:hypothetical protein